MFKPFSYALIFALFAIKDLIAAEVLTTDTFSKLAEKVSPAVVNIRSSGDRVKSKDPFRGTPDPLREMLEQLLPQDSLPPTQQSLGSGFLIEPDGLIVTNSHVVDDADKIEVQVGNDTQKMYQAEVIGKDQRTDLALIKINAKRKFPTLKLGKSSKLKTGQWVAAFGNPLGLTQTMTKGIVSAVGRELDRISRFPFIQTDASINPGNSGGPLVNLDGEVVGVNTAMANAQGIGFAIPIDQAKTIIAKLKKDGKVVRGFLGVNYTVITPEARESFNLSEKTQGVIVTDLVDDGPAEKGGIKVYDVITAFNGQEITRSIDLQNAVGDSPIGKKVPVNVIREGKRQELKVVVGTHPGDIRSTTPVPAPAITQTPPKTYEGQKAPFDLGFTIDALSDRWRERYGLDSKTQAPVIIELQPDSPASRAGLRVGDLVLEINRKAVKTPQDVLKALKPKQNSLRYERRGNKALVFLK